MERPPQPTLEDLRSTDDPAWLWDAARLRIVWANAAGLKFFGCDSLFDLIERPFDPREPGVAAIRAASYMARTQAGSRHHLQFPSMGPKADVHVRLYPHALADGRLGILAAGEGAATRTTENAATIRAAFDLHPEAMLIIGADGRVVDHNRSAEELLPPGVRWTLAGLAGGDTAAADILNRLGEASTLTFTRTIAARFGRRDIRFTALRLNEEAISLILTDVTERRALERSLGAGTPAPIQAHEPPVATAAALEAATAPPEPKSLSAEEQAAFEELGKALAPAPPASTPAPQKEPGIPDFIRAKLDAAPGANIYVKDGVVIHANPAALEWLGYRTPDEMEEGGLAAKLVPGPRIALRRGDGSDVDTEILREPFPWIGGPGDRYSLREPPRSPPNLVVIESTPVEDAPALTKPERSEVTAAEPAIAHTVRDSLPEPHNDNHGDSELRAVLDTVADGIITLDGKGQIKSFSAGAEAIFSTRTAEVLGKPFVSLLAQESRRIFRDYLSSVNDPGLGGLLNDGREVTALERSGGEVPLFLTLSRLREGHGFCAVVRDITQWKKTEEDLRRARDEALKTSRQKSEFLARISHELRTPLNAILGFSEVMRMERFGEIRNDKYRGYVNDIHTSGAHLLSLINDLLDLSKVEAGKLELNFTSVNLNEVADHAMRMVQDKAAAGRVILRKMLPAGLPNVVADLRSMRQIMINLLSNAVKFTDAGGQVTITAALNQAGELTLRVKDTGIGMNADQLRDALEPFQRVTTDGREAEGTGLGLPLTKALAEANRTVFAVTSEPKKGTTVEITFPVTRVLAG